MEGNHKEENEGQNTPIWAETILEEIPDEVIERYDIRTNKYGRMRIVQNETVIFLGDDKETSVTKNDTVVEIYYGDIKVSLWRNVDEIIVSL